MTIFTYFPKMPKMRKMPKIAKNWVLAKIAKIAKIGKLGKLGKLGKMPKNAKNAKNGEIGDFTQIPQKWDFGDYGSEHTPQAWYKIFLGNNTWGLILHTSIEGIYFTLFISHWFSIYFISGKIRPKWKKMEESGKKWEKVWWMSKLKEFLL